MFRLHTEKSTLVFLCLSCYFHHQTNSLKSQEIDRCDFLEIKDSLYCDCLYVNKNVRFNKNVQSSAMVR